MKVLMILMVSFIVIFTGCKGDSDILATYNGGDIKRGEFYSWLKNHKVNLKKTLEKKNEQKNRLKQYGIQKLTLNEAKSKKFEQNEKFIRISSLIKGNFIAVFWKKKISEKTEFKEEAIKTRQIKLFVKSYKKKDKKNVKLTESELENEYKQEVKKGEEIIAQLDKGVSFEELAKKHNSSRVRKNGGDIGYITIGQKGPEFGKHLFSLKNGEYSKQPFRFGKAIYILKAEKKVILDNDNIDDIIENKSKAKSLKRRLQQLASRKYFKNLKNGNNVKLMTENIENKDKNSIIFSVGEFKYRVKDLDSFILYGNESLVKQGRKPIKFDLKLKTKWVLNQFDVVVLGKDFVKNGGDKDLDFLSKWNTAYNDILSGYYKQEMVVNSVNVKESVVKDYYMKSKKRYNESKKKNKKKKGKFKKFESYSKVKDNLKAMIKADKIKSVIKNYDRAIVQKSNFKMLLKELEGK